MAWEGFGEHTGAREQHEHGHSCGCPAASCVGVFVLSYVFVLACMGMIVQPQVRELLHDPNPRAVIGVAGGCAATAAALLVERWMLRAHGWVSEGG